MSPAAVCMLAVDEAERDGDSHQQHDLLYDVEFVCVHAPKIQTCRAEKLLRKQGIILKSWICDAVHRQKG